MNEKVSHRVEKISAKETSVKGLLHEIHRQLLKLNDKKNNPVKKWTEDLNSHLTAEDTQMANKPRKGCATSWRCGCLMSIELH